MKWAQPELLQRVKKGPKGEGCRGELYELYFFFINFNCQLHADQNDLKKRILTRDCQFQAGLWACVLQIVSVKLISVRKFQLTVCVRQHFLG